MKLSELLSLDLATAALTSLQGAAVSELDTVAETARHMYNGHHLGRPIGGGETDLSYWRGPNFEASEGLDEASRREADAFLATFQRAVRRSFTSTNFVKQVLRRELGSATARMNWTIVDPAGQKGESERQQEADALLTAWWRTDKRMAERSVRTALLFARREGRGVLRFRVAAAALETSTAGALRIKTADMAELSRYIQLECIEHPEQVGTWQNPDTLTRHAAYRYKDAAGNDAAEVSSEEPGGLTLLRVVRGDTSSLVRLQLGGRLTILEACTDPAINEQFEQNQMAYNTSSTMILRNTELAGFIERYGINIEPPFVMEPDPDKPGAQRRRYKPVKTGPATINLWRGATYDQTDSQGNYQGEAQMGSPSYGRFEPVSPEALTTAADHAKLNMYSEVAQDYVLMSGLSTASGRSREVAISDFETMREPLVDLAVTLIPEVAETYLALVAALTNRPGYFEGLQVEGQVKTRVVPPSPEERNADREDAKEGVISVLRARQRQGIDTPEQEDTQIQVERDAGTSPTLAARPAEPVAAEVVTNAD